jgi:hypothetical protein
MGTRLDLVDVFEIRIGKALCGVRIEYVRWHGYFRDRRGK